MKKIFLLFSFVFISNQFIRATGGPDAYGYTWITSLDAGGPLAQFTDISTFPGATLVTGLADDNSAPSMVNIGFPFHYYWNDYTQMKIGSNGWASFDNVSNIASCFPTIPTSGAGGDNLIAALMSDLNFTGAGNAGQVFTYTNNIDTFIIMYKNVPYWSVNAPGWVGANSFEIILCGADSSITIQYGNLGGFTSNTACIDLTIGIENSTGAVGLQVHSDAMPPSNYAIKFEYPAVVLLSVIDPTMKWNTNADNLGVFLPLGSFNLTTNVKNAGNTAVTNTINVTGDILDATNTTIFTSNYTLPSLSAGSNVTTTFPTSPNILVAGQYSYRTTLTNSQDINSANNILTTEIDLVNVCSPGFTLGYVTNGFPDGSINWNGGANDDGVAIHIEPPVYPVIITDIQAYVSSNVSDGLIASVYDDDGPGGTAGTLLFTTTVPSGSIVTSAWNSVAVSPTINITSGGFYVAFFQTGTTIFIGTETAGPLSHRNYEILDGGWANFRYNDSRDLLIRCQLSNPGGSAPLQPGPITGPTDLCAGAGLTNYSITPVPGANTYTWTLPAGWDSSSTASFIDALPGTTGGNITVTADNFCGTSLPQTLAVNVHALPNVIANASADTVCLGDSTTLSGSGATIYVWSGGVSNGASFAPAGTMTYTVSGTDMNSCSNTDSITVLVNTPPTLISNASDTELCYGEFSTITLSGADIYTWYGNPTSGTLNFGPAVDTYGVAVGIDTVTGCWDQDTIYFTVHQLPIVTFNYSGNDTVCISNGNQTLSGGSPSGGMYSGTGVTGTAFDPSAAGLGSHSIVYTYTDGNGCSNTDNESIVVLGCTGIDPNKEISITIYPNPFTDVITISGIESATSIQVCNAWGQVIESRIATTSNEVISTSHLGTGIYFINIQTANGMITTKIIKH